MTSSRVARQIVQKSTLHRRSEETAYVRCLEPVDTNLWEAELAVGFRGETPRNDCLPLRYAVELVRQSGVSVAHLGCDVPSDDAFVMQDLHFAWRSAGVSRLQHARWTGRAVIQTSDHRWRHDRLTGLRVTIDLLQGSTLMARGGGLMRFLRPAQFRALRRHAALPSSARTNAHGPIREVTISGRRLRALLGWDTRDPLTFDHPLDHVPGLALVEAATAAAERLSSGTTQEFSFTFHRFTEFSPATVIRAYRYSAGDVAVAMSQTEHRVMSGRVRVRHQRQTDTGPSESVTHG